MKKLLLLTILLQGFLFASLRVDTTYSTMGKITQEIGGDLVSVTVLGSAKYDPHFIVPKPSLISKLRRADLLIINGGGLELGWLPPLLRAANNAKIQNGAKGLLDMSHSISMIDVPTSVSRAFGDVHAQGNPHFVTDPHQVLVMAEAIKQKLIELDPENEKIYQDNFNVFQKKWQNYLQNFDTKMQMCRGKKVVQYHELYNYFLKRYDIQSIGNIEPLPGIAPSSKHTLELIMKMRQNHVKTILQDVYHEQKTAAFIADKTGAKVQIIPHDIHAVKGSNTLENFYDIIGKRICN